jgi:hypothetical protein
LSNNAGSAGAGSNQQPQKGQKMAAMIRFNNSNDFGLVKLVGIVCQKVTLSTVMR